MDRDEQRLHSRREFSKDVAYEIFKPSWRNESFNARVTDISRGGACIIAEWVHEPGVVLHIWPHPQRSMDPDKKGPTLAQVRWVAPIWERPKKARFRIGLQFLTKSLYGAILDY